MESSPSPNAAAIRPPQSRTRQRDVRVKERALLTRAQRGLGAIRVIQAFTTEEDEHRQFVASSTASLDSNLRFYIFQSLFTAFIGMVMAGGTAVVLWVGATHVRAGQLTLGEALVFLAYLDSLYGLLPPRRPLSYRFGVPYLYASRPEGVCATREPPQRAPAPCRPESVDPCQSRPVMSSATRISPSAPAKPEGP